MCAGKELYSEYREWMSDINEEGELSEPDWVSLREEQQRVWHRVAAKFRELVREEILSNI